MGGTTLGAGGNTLGAGGGTLKPVEFGGLRGAEVACSEAFVRVLLLSRTEVADSEAFPTVPFGSLCFGTVSAKIKASCLMALCWVSPSRAKGVAGCGFLSA
jgi:hypothetical protein